VWAALIFSQDFPQCEECLHRIRKVHFLPYQSLKATKAPVIAIKRCLSLIRPLAKKFVQEV